MGEPPRLTRSPINRHANIDDVADFAEEAVEFAVGNIEGHVADEEGARRIRKLLSTGSAGARAVVGGVLDVKTAAFEGLVVIDADRGVGRFLGTEDYVAEPEERKMTVSIDCKGQGAENYPLLNPRLSITTLTL